MVVLDLTLALPTFLITLREGVEAALVVGIVLACLNKADRSHLNAWAYGGIGVGLAGSILLGAIFSLALWQVGTSTSVYAPIVREVLEASFCLGAIILLSWMLVWMTQQARSLKGEIEGSVSQALETNGKWGILGLVAIAVLREGLETVLFIMAQVQAGWMPSLGAVAGVLGATGIGFLLFKGGVKINLRLFFQLMGILLLLIVSGLVISLFRKVEVLSSLMIQLDPVYASLCWSQASCFLGLQVWNTSQVLPERGFPGIVLKALFGYRDHLYLVQAIGYLAFLISVGGLYLKSLGVTFAAKRY
jgi:high-affinity iron transporter